jgi:putative ABC transport system permease protein
MRLLNVLSARLRALLGREAVIGDIDEELRLHLEMEAEANVGKGMAPEEARRAALRTFGNFDSIRERAYEVRGGGIMESISQDIRYAVRMLTKRAGFTAVAALTLALGVGANTAIFSVVEAVLLRDLPYPNAEKIVMVWERYRQNPDRNNVVGPANFKDWRAQAKSFDEMAAFYDVGLNLTGSDEPEEVASQVTTANLFNLLGVDAALGRTFTPEDVKAERLDIAVLGHDLWQRRFGGSRDIVGKTITLNGEKIVVIGVLPENFKWFIKEMSRSGKPAQLWLPTGLSKPTRENSGRYMQSVARLAPGVSLEQAQVEMNTIAARLESQYVDYNKGWSIKLVPLRDQISGEIRPALLVLLGAVGCVLLISCVNVASLLLARAAGRHKEMAVRSAMGAGRRRIIRQLLTESLLLALLGGLLGLLLSRWCVQGLVALSPANLISVEEVVVSLPVLAFTLAVSLLTGIVFGLAPALEASRVKLSETLKESSRGATGSARGRRMRNVLVVVEVGLALVLLVGAGLMIRSFMRLQGINPGFDAENVLTMRLALPGSKYSEASQVVNFYREAVGNIGTLPGVISASATSAPPFAGLGSATSFTIEGRPAPPPGEELSTDVRVVEGEYFRALKIPVVAGRTFNQQEMQADRKVAVINESMARLHFPSENPIGKSLRVEMMLDPQPTEIIGIVGDARYGTLEGELRPMVYWPSPQLPHHGMTLVLRTSVEPESVAAAARREIQKIDKDQPVSEVRTMEGWLSEYTARTRFGTLLLAGFALLALILAAIGIYGVMSHSVVQRQNEIGVRMALGAKARDVLLLVIRQGLALVLVGVALGLLGALALTRVLSSLLYEVSATDPLTFAAIALLLTAVSCFACYLPARRAARVDPLTAMRYD